MANINDEKRTPTYTQHKDGASTILSIRTDDGFAAARLCSIGLMGMWAREFQDDLVIAIPTKEHLYAVPSSDKAGVAYIKDLAAKQFATEERNLTDKLFVFHVADGTITAFTESTRQPPSPRYVFLPKGPVHGGPVTTLPTARLKIGAKRDGQ